MDSGNPCMTCNTYRLIQQIGTPNEFDKAVAQHKAGELRLRGTLAPN